MADSSSKPNKALRKFIVTGFAALSLTVSTLAFSGQVEFVNNGSFETTTASKPGFRVVLMLCLDGQ